MTQEELLKRIKNVDYLTITNMSYEVIAQLTQDFKSLMVKELLKRGNTNVQQRAIMKAIKRSYKEWFKNENGVWSDFPGVFKYPKFLEDLQVDIECGFMITDEKEADNIEERMDDYMAKHTMSKEDIDKAISDAESNTVTDEKSSETIAALEEHIIELEAENADLKNTIAELQQPVEEVPAVQKVRMELAFQLLKKAGLTDDVLQQQNNKQKVATVMSILLDIHNKNKKGNEAQTCATYLSARDLSHSRHEDTINIINALLKELNIEVQI